jgi:hypothetical protein
VEYIGRFTSLVKADHNGSMWNQSPRERIEPIRSQYPTMLHRDITMKHKRGDVPVFHVFVPVCVICALLTANVYRQWVRFVHCLRRRQRRKATMQERTRLKQQYIYLSMAIPGGVVVVVVLRATEVRTNERAKRVLLQQDKNQSDRPLYVRVNGPEALFPVVAHIHSLWLYSSAQCQHI